MLKFYLYRTSVREDVNRYIFFYIYSVYMEESAILRERVNYIDIIKSTCIKS